MKIYFLGTGTSQGIPVIGNDSPVCLSSDSKDKRLRTSIFVEWDTSVFQIDCGPDFRQQMLVSKCPKIDALLFTHEHADHTAGFDDIRPFCFMQKAPIPIYGQERVINELKKRFEYIFETENRYPGAPSVDINVIEENKSFQIDGKDIIPITVLHGDLPILGYRFQNFTYLTDVKYITEENLFKLQDLDVLVINALRINEHPTHNNLEEALNFIKIIKPKKAYLTHIGFQLGFHDEVQKSLPKDVYLAYDNLQLTI
ncbi:MBL fold metallo-hydrolase [Paenimyroides tangerinum]|uniref:MBL fold metallo-hydrolase n=1 Tax=Paenimyroides tangerinum TaxID=2488728 RepID=A0A3P3W2G2_9FLAO|nr:MBL fold metallo-hydrolase [Paenimyroides tangerinum]RRJ88558.1 MBL fold metallo-hydrolase [Paenimyroides tangerinum]